MSSAGAPRVFVGGYKPTPKSVLGDCEAQDLKRFRSVRRAGAPATADATPFVCSVFDQGRERSCVAVSGAGCVRLTETRELAELIASDQGISVLQAASIVRRDPPDWISIQLAYYLCQSLDGNPGVDAGTFCTSFWTVLDQYGFARESAWPYVVGDIVPEEGRLTELLRLAYDQRTANFRKARLLTTGDDLIADIKAAIAAGYPVQFGGPVDDSYSELTYGQRWRGCGKGAAYGHARYWAKYDQQGPWEVGSYGTEWATCGLAPSTWDSVHQCDDIWVIERMPFDSGTEDA